MNAAVSGGSMVHANVCDVLSASTKSAMVASAVSTANAPRRARMPACVVRWRGAADVVGGAGFTSASRAHRAPRARLSSGTIEPPREPPVIAFPAHPGIPRLRPHGPVTGGLVAAESRAPADAPGQIATPDRRLRVFVSSTLEELAAERSAVRAAVRRLHLTPVMFDLGARAHPPRELYRAYLEQSDVFVGVYGERYGWIAPDMGISGLEDEYELSAAHPRLLYVRRTAPAREPRLAELITRMQSESGSSTTPYDDPEDLAERVADDLAVLLTERFAAPRAAPIPGLAAGWLPTPAASLVDRRGGGAPSPPPPRAPPARPGPGGGG